MRHTIIFLLILTLLSSFVFATETEYFKANDINYINIPCYNDGKPCGATTTCNITISNKYEVSIFNQEMSKSGNMFSYEITPITLGKYDATIFCVEDDIYGSYNIKFEVNNMGEKRENSGYIITFLLFFVVIVSIISIFSFKQKKYLIAVITLPVISLLVAFIFFILYLYSIILTNIFWTLFLISSSMFVVLLLLTVYEVVFELLTGLNKRKRSVFSDNL